MIRQAQHLNIVRDTQQEELKAHPADGEIRGSVTFLVTHILVSPRAASDFLKYGRAVTQIPR